MKVGLLWFDDNPGRDLAGKVSQAERRYRQKFGTAANVCFVHPATLNGNAGLQVDGVTVKGLSTVLRYHFWVGVEEAA